MTKSNEQHQQSKAKTAKISEKVSQSIVQLKNIVTMKDIEPLQVSLRDQTEIVEALSQRLTNVEKARVVQEEPPVKVLQAPESTSDKPVAQKQELAVPKFDEQKAPRSRSSLGHLLTELKD